MLHQVKSDSDGRYDIVIGRGDVDLEFAELVVQRISSGYRSRIGPIKSGERIELNPVLKPDVSIKGSVVSWNGQPMREVLVEAVPVSDVNQGSGNNRFPHAWEWTDARGEFQFSHLPEHTYRLRIHTPDGFVGIRRSLQTDGNPHSETLFNDWEEGSPLKVVSGSDLEGLHFRIPSFEKPRVKSFDQIAKFDDIQVLSMAFDRAERLWVGFEKGGLAVGENGSFQSLSSDQFPEKKVRTLLHDGNRLWVGTDHGVYWQLGAEQIFRKPDVFRELADHEIWSLTLGGDGKVWVGSDQGLFCYSPTDPEHLERVNAFDAMWIRDVLAEDGKPVWVATWGNGVFEQTDAGWKQWEGRHGLVHRHVSSLMRDQEDRVWIGTDGGVSIFNPTDQSFSNKTMETGLMDHYVTDIVQGESGTIWVSTKGAGLARVDGDSWTVWFDSGVLPHVYVNQCLIDPGGDLWVGTQAGLTRLDYRHLRILKLRTSIMAMEGNDENKIWIGTEGHGVFYYDGNDFQQITTHDGLAHDHVSCILVDPETGHSFVGGPIGFSELENEKVVDTYLNPNKPEGVIPEIRDIAKDATGHFWLASWLKGLIRFDHTSRLTTRYGMEGKQADYHARCVAVSPAGEVWCGTENGLYVLREDRLELDSAVSILSDASIADLEYEPGGEALWIVSDMGVYRFGADRELTRMSPEHLTRLSRGEQIRFSPEKDVAWLSLSFGGVGVYNRGQWSVIETLKGLPASHRTIQAIYIGDADAVWGGTSAGVFRWKPTITTPKVRVALKSEHSHTHIHPDQEQAKRIKLLADRRLTISFSSASMVGSQLEHVYQYRLLDDKSDDVPWKIIPGDQSDDLIIGQPGRYALEYRGLDELANAYPPSQVAIDVLPNDYYTPWYQKTRFIIFLSMVAVCMVALSGVILRKYIHGKDLLVQQRELYLQDLELRVSDRTQALQKAYEEAVNASKAKNEFLSRMSHELRTPLNSIIGFSRLMQLAVLPSPMDQNATRIHKAGQHLLGLINEILDISTIESRKVTLQLEAVPLEEVIGDVIEMIKPLAATRAIQIFWDAPNGNIPPAMADRKRLQQALINLANNGIKYNRKGGRLSFAVIAFSSGPIQIKIQDTGNGISSENLKRLFKPFDRLDVEQAEAEIDGTGLGLTISKKLVEFMGGYIRVTSQEGKGSVFTIELNRYDEELAFVAEKAEQGKA